jgi:hypothetical protein
LGLEASVVSYCGIVRFQGQDELDLLGVDFGVSRNFRLPQNLFPGGKVAALLNREVCRYQLAIRTTEVANATSHILPNVNLVVGYVIL